MKKYFTLSNIYTVSKIIFMFVFLYLFYIQTYDISNEIYNLRMKIDDIDTELSRISDITSDLANISYHTAEMMVSLDGIKKRIR